MDRPTLRRRGLVVALTAPERRAPRARRERILAALEQCGDRERLVLALLLVERLSPAEAASAMGMPVARLLRTYRGVMADLERIASGRIDRAVLAAPRRRSAAAERLRRAS